MKSHLKTLILGSYSKRNKNRLKKLQKQLIFQGYTSTRLVEDFPDQTRFSEDDDKHFSIKSEHYIKNWAHAIIFILYNKSNNQGVTSEFRYAYEQSRQTLDYSLLLYEKGLHVSTQIKGPAKRSTIEVYEFSNPSELFEAALAKCINNIEELWETL
jgi:hypothetical protein